MPSQEAIFFNNLFKNAPKKEKHDYFKEREEGRERPKPPVPKGVMIEEMTLGGNYCERLTKEGNKGPTILYIHGGGFTTGAAQERREITFEIVANRGCNVIANNYRLAPENKWPAQLEDCVAVYLEILKLGYNPGDLVVMGESAGATLAVSLPLYLRDHGYPLPAVSVAYSVCSNQRDGFPSHVTNAATDYMIGDSVNREDQIEAVFGIENQDELRNDIYASPYYADFTGMPPVFLAASDTEALYDDSVYLYEKLKKAGHPVELDIQHELCHAYPMFPNIPEAKVTLDKAFAFIEKNVTIQNPLE